MPSNPYGSRHTRFLAKKCHFSRIPIFRAPIAHRQKSPLSVSVFMGVSRIGIFCVFFTFSFSRWSGWYLSDGQKRTNVCATFSFFGGRRGNPAPLGAGRKTPDTPPHHSQPDHPKDINRKPWSVLKVTKITHLITFYTLLCAVLGQFRLISIKHRKRRRCSICFLCADMLNRDSF